MATPSFMRGLFTGEIADELLFPYPAPLDERNAEEAAIVRELTAALNEMIASGLIDSAKFDAEETIPDAVIDAMAQAKMFAIATPKEFGGLGLSLAAYARVFGCLLYTSDAADE